MTVAELLARMGQREIMEWEAHFMLKAEEHERDGMAQAAVSGAANRRWSR